MQRRAPPPPLAPPPPPPPPHHHTRERPDRPASGRRDGLRLLSLALALAPPRARGDNGVGLTPAMGYNTWDDSLRQHQRQQPDEGGRRDGGPAAARAGAPLPLLVRYPPSRLSEASASCPSQHAVRTAAAGRLLGQEPRPAERRPPTRPAAFPQGMKAVADYVHSKGLLGVYTDRGEHTCVGRPGSQGYEKLDAKTYAEWGVG